MSRSSTGRKKAVPDFELWAAVEPMTLLPHAAAGGAAEGLPHRGKNMVDFIHTLNPALIADVAAGVLIAKAVGFLSYWLFALMLEGS
jgi:hypothetical protein